MKKWSHYFFEFLMLFLAVTLGFFVDNLRSDLSDRQLESQHIKSLLSDLRQDTALFHRQIAEKKFMITICDSVAWLLNLRNRSAHDNQRLYFLFRIIAPNTSALYLNERTFEEMRNSGALRLIHSKSVADSISQYYFDSKEFSFINQIMLDRAERRLELESQVFDATVYEKMVNKKTFAFTEPEANPQLITEDKVIINELMVMTHYTASVSSFNIFRLTKFNDKAIRLINLIEQEYQLKKPTP